MTGTFERVIFDKSSLEGDLTSKITVPEEIRVLRAKSTCECGSSALIALCSDCGVPLCANCGTNIVDNYWLCDICRGVEGDPE